MDAPCTAILVKPALPFEQLAELGGERGLESKDRSGVRGPRSSLYVDALGPLR